MKGRAFVFTGVQQPFEARDFRLPDVEPDAILVRVTVANICGSDLHGWHGRTPRSGPTVMGHEMTGRVEKLGARVTADAAGAPLREGDRIVYSYFYPCRRCDPCRAGDPHHCVARRIGAGRAPSDAPSPAPTPTTTTCSPATTCSARRTRSTTSPWRRSTARSPR